MSRHGRLNHGIRWAALLAFVLATLAPGIAHALRLARGDTLPWSQLCSATGGKRVLFESHAGEPGSTPHAHAFQQCTQCALHSAGSAPPPVAAELALRADLRAVTPPLQSLPQPARPGWLGAQPRAPPLHA